jgi:hypothetical protein
MKIFESGDQKAVEWWVGRTLKCSNCNRTVELEAQDVGLPSINFVGISQLVYQCETCNNDIILEKSPSTEKLITETAPQQPAQDLYNRPSNAAPFGNPKSSSNDLPANRAANVGNNTTTGWSNPFKGTSWGV